MPKLLNKVNRLLEIRGETFQSLLDRLQKYMPVKSRQTLYDWLNESHQPRDPNAFRYISEILGVELDDLLNPNIRTPKITKKPEAQTSRSVNLAVVLLDVLTSPDASESDKEVARYTILRMLEERPRHAF